VKFTQDNTICSQSEAYIDKATDMWLTNIERNVAAGIKCKHNNSKQTGGVH